MTSCVTGCISKDFPLYHSKLIPTYESPDKHNYNHKRPKNTNTFTNEHPDLFRLDGMKEGGYKNPFLNEVIKVDRSEYLKKLSTDRKNVNFIDFIKSKRQYSQDPKIIRYISSDVDTELKHKRMGRTNLTDKKEKNEENKNSFEKNVVLTEGNESNNMKKYNNLIKSLNYYVPKIDYRIKRTLDINDNTNNKSQNSNDNKEIENDCLYNKIIIGVDPKISNNLRNTNDFNIRGTEKDDDFKFNRKSIYKYNPIKDRMETINPPQYKNYKWTPFLENYFLLSNSPKRFQRKGGLFSEFCNKNIGSINNNKYDIQQRLKKEKEEKEKLEGKKSDK